MIYHIAFRSDWEQARAAGEYRVSTRGHSLEEVGFIHGSADHDQARMVARLVYADCTEPLCLLVIDPDQVHAEIRMDYVDAQQQSFPHIYGPLNTDAVVEVRDFTVPAAPRS